MKTRLNKFLAEAGIASRREADELIKSGKIRLNNYVVKELGIQVDPSKDSVSYNGKTVESGNDFVYYALYKPKGVISTAKDEMGRATVLDLVPKTPRVYPAGRLDADSEGLMILTNDGELTHTLTHPSFEHTKEYVVKGRKLQNSEITKEGQIKELFERGLLIDGMIMKADKVFDLKELGRPSNFITFKLILHTGYNRQIRKMCAKIGLEVLVLVRTKIALLSLSQLKLKPGQYKKITKVQIVK